jgi:hypothetical protein
MCLSFFSWPLTFFANIRLALKKVSGTCTLAYFSPESVTKKKSIFDLDTSSTWCYATNNFMKKFVFFQKLNLMRVDVLL